MEVGDGIDKGRLAGTVLAEADTRGETFDQVAMRVQELCGRSIVTICTYDAEHDSLVCQTEVGSEGFAAFSSVLRRNPVSRHFHIPAAYHEKVRQPFLHMLAGGLHTLFLGSVPRAVSRTVELVLRVRSVYAMALVKDGEFFGTVGIVSRLPHLEAEQAAATEAYIQRVTPMLYRANVRHHRKVRDAEYRLLMERSVDALVVVNGEGRILDINPAACARLGCDLAEATGARLSDLTRRSLLELFGRFRRLQPGESQERVCRIRSKGGRVLLCGVQVVAIVPDRYLVTLTDRSEQLAVERSLLEVTRKERQRIGRDLHDSVGQSLTGISLLAHSLGEELANTTPDASCRAGEIRDAARGLIGEVRRIADGLTVSPVEEGGLAGALCELAIQVGSQAGLRCLFREDRTEVELPLVVSDELHLFCKEAVHNAVRHSGCSQILISLDLARAGCELIIEDDGKGLGSLDSKGMGFRTMQYRADLIGGELCIETPPQGGTRVRCMFHSELGSAPKTATDFEPLPQADVPAANTSGD